MGLREYRRKRDFGKTPEPAGGKAARKRTGSSFVIQKHAASRLHYDFRLEMEGVLRSWSVPKGPHLDPAQKRLAVHVEDHPLEYGGFEGVIPKGQYGGGTVMLWDRGTWEPLGDASRDYRRGRLEFRMRGDRMEGTWALIRMHGREGDDDGRNWLLIKKTDEFARRGRAGDLTARHTTSVTTGRTMEDIAAQRDRVWDGRAGELPPARAKRAGAKSRPRKRAAKAKPPARRAAGRASRAAPARSVLPKGARAAPFPTRVAPELATLVDEAPRADDWIHEIKFDGYRMLVFVENGKARLLTRNAKDWTDRFRAVADAAALLPVKDALLDGEVVAVRPDGVTDFQTLQSALGSGGRDLVYYAFDLLHLDGHDLRRLSLLERKEALRALLARGSQDRIRYSDHVLGRGEAFFEQACRAGIEGIVSKRADAAYVGRRTRDWLKVRCQKGQEFVVAGWTDPSGSRAGLGSLVLAVYGADGALRYAGKVGTGFDDATLNELRRKLGPLERRRSPLEDPPRGEDARGVHWAKPTLVAEVAFTEWTRDGRLRHATFRGLRADKPAREVVREMPKDTDRVEQSDAPEAPATRASGRRGAGEDTTVVGVRLTSPDRVLYPAQGITKRELAEYYEAVAEWMLPHVRRRALTLVRCPAGHEKECFYQKHAGEAAAPGLAHVEVNPGEQPYYAIESPEGLVSLVQMGVLEIHPWGSRTDDLDRPDRLFFDLDPDEGLPWERTLEMTRAVRDWLEEIGLRSFLKTTGGKGLHVVVPLVRRHDFDEVKAFAEAFAKRLAADHPARVVAVASKAKRKGKIYLDWLRNGRGSTAVAAYSSRAKPGAPVAMPLSWDELRPDVHSNDWTVRNAMSRLNALREDPWAEMDSVRQTITKATQRAVGLG